MLVKNQRTRLLIINKKTNEFLVLVRNLKDKCGFDNRVILLPGGGVDDGEGEIASLLREVNEEIGYKPWIISKIMDVSITGPGTENLKLYYPDVTKVDIVYSFWVEVVEKNIEIELKEKEKFDGFHWVNKYGLVKLSRDLGASIDTGLLEARNTAVCGSLLY